MDGWMDGRTASKRWDGRIDIGFIDFHQRWRWADFYSALAMVDAGLSAECGVISVAVASD